MSADNNLRSQSCPFLKRFGIENATCDFIGFCDHTGRNCQWAKFHGLDPFTLKPEIAEKQGELFS